MTYETQLQTHQNETKPNETKTNETTYGPALGFGGVVSAMWLWLRVMFTGVGVQAANQYTYDLDPNRPCVNRAVRHRTARLSRAGVPPVRNLLPFYAFGRRNITPTQFLERCCRLSLAGRISVYRIRYFSHRLVREAFMAIFKITERRPAGGLWRVHLWPS